MAGVDSLWQSPEYRKQMVFLAVWERHPAAKEGFRPEKGPEAEGFWERMEKRGQENYL